MKGKPFASGGPFGFCGCEFGNTQPHRNSLLLFSNCPSIPSKSATSLGREVAQLHVGHQRGTLRSRLLHSSAGTRTSSLCGSQHDQFGRLFDEYAAVNFAAGGLQHVALILGIDRLGWLEQAFERSAHSSFLPIEARLGPTRSGPSPIWWQFLHCTLATSKNSSLPRSAEPVSFRIVADRSRGQAASFARPNADRAPAGRGLRPLGCRLRALDCPLADTGGQAL